MINGSTYEYVNLELILDLADGESDFFKELIKTYLRSLPQNIEKLQQAADANNLEDLVFFAHKLKGSINFIGTEKLNVIVGTLDAICHDGKDLEPVPALVSQIAKAAVKVYEELNDILLKAQKPSGSL